MLVLSLQLFFRSSLSPLRGFPGDSDHKEPTCNVGDLGWEDPLEEGMATHSSTLAQGQRSLVGYSPWGGKESDMTATKHS